MTSISLIFVQRTVSLETKLSSYKEIIQFNDARWFRLPDIIAFIFVHKHFMMESKTFLLVKETYCSFVASIPYC